MTTTESTAALKTFKKRRDALLHEDVKGFEDYLFRFVKFCNENAIAQKVLSPLASRSIPDPQQWLEQASQDDGPLPFPDDSDDEFILRFKVIDFIVNNEEGKRYIWSIGFNYNARKRDDSIELFRTLIIQPFAEEMGERLGEVMNLASPDDRAIQAVPLNRIPSPSESKIFLSHKSTDKTLVRRYFKVLQELGFNPWLDEYDMTAGVNLEREILRGFHESCAVVFFITENFKDENFLATEIDYAIAETRKKNKKFKIITFRYSDTATIPDLLKRFIFKDVENDLEGFHELLRALPIEAGPIRWKADVVD